MATFDEFYQSLPEDSNKRGEFFEKVFVPWFLKTDPEWSTKVKKIWLWDEYPGRWGRDCGIDLVYEDRQGNHWAVQSKCVAPDREISKAEIDSFLSESNDSRIHGRLLIASTDGIGKNALQVLERQEKQVVCFLREHFLQSAVEFPSSPEDLSSGRRKDRREPRPHQEEAISNVVEGLQEEDRGQLLMACGTGKTLTSLWIKEALSAKRTLVLLPSLSLLSQTLREWTATSREEFNWICVCSDKSVTKKGEEDEDDWIKNISALGVPVTSDQEDIRQFLHSNREGVVFSTYQSSPLIAEAQKSSDIPAFDIAFADEAHRCAGKVSPAFGCILDSRKIRAEKRLFMTATPRVMSNRIKSRAETEDIEIASMDDEGLFGKVLHRLNFSEAIERDLLTDYRVVVIGVDDPSIQAEIINRPLSSTATGIETDYETLANHISLSKSMREYDLQRVITFHGRVKTAQKFSEDHAEIVNWLPESSKAANSIKTGYVSGRMTSLERNSKINQLRNLEEGEIGILSNARCLSEGVDVPTLDGIAFIDPRSSQVDIIQAVGRAIRKSESKSYGYIVLPVYLGDIDTIEEEILASRFKDVWEIILALKSQDDSLTEVLDRLRVELGKRGEKGFQAEGLTKIIFDIPKRVENTIGNSLRILLVKNTSDRWNEVYGQLQEFVESANRLPRKSDSLQLINWISEQRNKYKNHSLIKARLKRLERIPVWEWDPLGGKQEEWVDAIEKYYEDHGHLSIDTKDGKLGGIITMIRNGYVQGKLKEDTLHRLIALRDKGWMWNTVNEAFEERVLFLKDWCTSNNSASPPRGTICAGNARTYSKEERVREFDLGMFTTRVRYLYRAMKHPNARARTSKSRDESVNSHRKKLSDYEIEFLESIPGWYWDKFDGYIRVYQECIRRNIEIKSSTIVDFDLTELRGIGRWIIKTRSNALRGNLHIHEIQLLETVPDWSYEPIHDTFMKGIGEYVSYANRLGTHRVAQNVVKESGFRLGAWVNRVRQSAKSGKLSENPLYSDFYARLLSDYGFIWDTRG